jgi:subtilase family serine protease/exonuclease VII small subunit
MEDQQTINAEVPKHRQALAQLDSSLADLERQQAQLQRQIAGYEWQMQLARQGDQEHLARQAWEQRQRLYPYLLSVRQQIEQLRRQRASLAGPEAPGDTPSGAESQAALPAGGWMGTQQPPPKRRRRTLALTLAGLAVIVVLAPLALLLTRQVPAPVTQKKAAASSTSAPTATPTLAPQQPFYTPNGTAPTSRDCQSTVGHFCYSPEQLQEAYRLNTLYRAGYDGSGQTIVILGAGNTTTLENDLHQFDLAWGLPDPHFTILHPFGPPVPYTCPDGQDDLEGENTLDVEWSHAIAPGANITLVIGSNDSGGPARFNCGFVGLIDTFAYALNHRLGNIISMSYGGSELGGVGESASEKQQDQAFFDSAHQFFKQAAAEGVTVLASSGDSGATNGNGANASSVWNTPNVSWPASDPYVLAVGGTQLTLQDAVGDYGSEVVWNSDGGATGGGLSILYDEPAYQLTSQNQKLFGGKRGIPDVSFPAAISYALYGSFEQGELARLQPKWANWHIIGGTSASAPCWAGLIAIANQMRGGPVGFIQPALYSLIGQGMHDITRGNNTLDGVQGYSAGPGYDLVTGWGTPIADQFIPALVQEINRMETGCGTVQRQCE